jgi:hypothetical protein
MRAIDLEKLNDALGEIIWDIIRRDGKVLNSKELDDLTDDATHQVAAIIETYLENK